ncbi:hypothetical protein PQO03_02610 [Lentisphaera profundi]|uniref:Uncharacterized protein n=1 Tax=Lentisphaera profundi TaxID=1658616 RepID=A0ABY7VVD7_9BACT|nr:hypothetical protein [Lentisphaera profundi]WDE96852.1 hypothetical protein PQO03_02610 [Lentisphaera profundi]
MRPRKKDLHVPISQELIKKILPLLGDSEDLADVLESLLKQEVAKRTSLDVLQFDDVLAELESSPCFPEISEEIPMKPQYSDLKHIDRGQVISLLQSCDYIDKDKIDAIPKELQALMEHDIMSSHWYPREDWEDLLNDYLDNGSHTTLDSWIEARKKNQLDDEAAMWVELSRRSLDDH